MEYLLSIINNHYDNIIKQFCSEPFVMQSAFLLSQIKKKLNDYEIILKDFILLKDTDYQIRLPDCMSFYSNILLYTLRTAVQNNMSIIYLHSHQNQTDADNCSGCEDEKMIFRLSYAYIPFGVQCESGCCQQQYVGQDMAPSACFGQLAAANCS